MEHPKYGTLYRHYKGGLYLVIGVAKHSETLEELVMYTQVDQDGNKLGQHWVRPLSMWFEDVNGTPRFTRP